MSGIAGPFSSSSATRLDQLTQSGPVTASQNSSALAVQLRGSGASLGGIASRGRSNVGGLQFGNLAANSQLTLTTTDNGAVATAAGILRDVIASQASLALNAVGLANDSQARLSEVATTRTSDGANLTQGTTQLGLVAAAAVAVVLGLVFIYLKAKR